MKKIAVIEDDELLNKALVITLEKEGYQVTAGKSCRDGIALLQDNPDLMLVDINLPDGNGISICREAERFSKIPVLFLTARDEERDMLEAFEAGCDDYVVKPFQMSVLKKRIEAILRRSGGEEDSFLFRGLRINWKNGTIRFNKYLMDDANANEKLNVVMHEFGHALGLGHNDKSDVMYKKCNAVVNLTKNDKQSYNAAYKHY